MITSAVGTLCPLCRKPMKADQPLALDHSVPLALDSRSRGDRIVHATCNSRAGARVRRRAA